MAVRLLVRLSEVVPDRTVALAADGVFDLGARYANVSELAIAHRPQLSDGRLVQAPARVARPPAVCRCPQRRRNMRMDTFVADCRAREWSAHDDLLSVFLC